MRALRGLPWLLLASLCIFCKFAIAVGPNTGPILAYAVIVTLTLYRCVSAASGGHAFFGLLLGFFGAEALAGYIPYPAPYLPLFIFASYCAVYNAIFEAGLPFNTKNYWPRESFTSESESESESESDD